MISYSLYKNPVKPGEDNYRALVKSRATLDLDEIVRRMMAHGSTVTEADVYAVLIDFFTILLQLLLDGFRIKTPMFNIGVSIRGNFKDPQDSFSRQRHQFEVIISVTRPFRRKIQNQAQARKLSPIEPEPYLSGYFNPNSDAGNDVLIPGGGARLTGRLLSFDPADPDQGIFLKMDGQAARRVEVIFKNAPSELIFLVPRDLPAGEYTLEVRSRFGQEIRSGRWKKTLAVQ